MFENRSQRSKRVVNFRKKEVKVQMKYYGFLYPKGDQMNVTSRGDKI